MDDRIINFQGFALQCALALGAFLYLWFLRGRYVYHYSKKPLKLPPLTEVPRLLVLRNLLQLKDMKPHKTFTKWAETYGPIYSIRLGFKPIVVLNSNDLVKEAVVTRFSSISTRKLTNALMLLSSDKTMVSVSDYDDFHRTAKQHLLTNILGPNAQKRHRSHRDALIENTSNQLHALFKYRPIKAINFREIFQSELLGLTMKQIFGEDVESIHVTELGITMSKDDMFKCLVDDPIEGSIMVDWRDNFPYLKWIPNVCFDKKITAMCFHRDAVMKSLIQDQQKHSSSRKDMQCYFNYLLSEGKTLSDKQIQMLLWEVIIATADTTLVATEWALYELAKDSNRQERLYQEISYVCGSDKITEEKLSQLPYLYAVFHETLRKHSPVPIVPLRHAHRDTQLGGYFVPAGSQIALNIYGCNTDKKAWKNPEEWKPERFLSAKCETTELYKTMSFGGGKRVCAGAQEAMTISRMTIGRLVQEFEWRLKDGEEDDVSAKGLTARKLHPMLALIRPRGR